MGNKSFSNGATRGSNNGPPPSHSDAPTHAHTTDEETNAIVSVSGERKPSCPGGLEELILNVTLVCTAESTREEKRLVLKLPPHSTVSELKRQLQSQLGIPACVQTLTFGHARLEDDRTLRYYTIRDEDQLLLEYPTMADIEEIASTIEHMKKMTEFLDSVQTQIAANPVPLELRTEIADNVDWAPVETLATEYLLSTRPRANTNRLLFARSGGLALVHRLHSLLLGQPWDKVCSVRLQYLEKALLRVVWNVTACFEVRREVLAPPSHLDNIVASFLRVPIPPRGSVRAPPNMYMTTVGLHDQDAILCQVLFKSLGALCNLAELSECQLQICSDKRVLDQLAAVLLTPTYTSIASQVAMGGLLCLAYHPQAHPHLLTRELVGCVIEACYSTTRHVLQQPCEDLLLLRYFATMFLAHVTTATPEDLVPELPSVLSFMDDFLSTASHKEVRVLEERNGFVWSTVLPSFRLAFQPHPQTEEEGEEGIKRRTYPSKDEEDGTNRCGEGHTYSSADHKDCVERRRKELWLLSMEAGVFSLQNMLLSPAVRKVMAQEEGLSGYLACMPWSLPSGSRAWQRAQDLVADVRPLLLQEGACLGAEAPTLQVMARAKLAVSGLGLERAVKSSVQQIAAELYPKMWAT